MQIKVVIPTRLVVPPACGGLFQYTAGLLNALSRCEGVEVHAELTPANTASFEKHLLPEVKITHGVDSPESSTLKSKMSHEASAVDTWYVHPFPDVREDYDAKKGIRVRHCCIIHDLQHVELPSFFTAKDRWKRDKAFGKAINKCDLLAANSDYTAKSVETIYSHHDNYPSVVYAGTEGGASCSNHARWDKPFIFYPANSWPHKNHQKLLEAFKILSGRRLNLQLILTGEPPQAEALRRLMRLADRVTHLGYVPRETVNALQRSAECLVFPSLYEGFGIPVIEALQAGTPVACSNTTSLPEVGGQAAEYFDPNDPAQIADAVERAIHNRHKPGWVDTARKQAAQFTFERTANLLLHAMQEVSSRGSDPDIERRCLTHPRLSEYWEHFPSLDAVLLPCCCQDLDHVTPDEFKALSNLDMARLNPQNLGSLFVRGDRVSIDSSPSPLAPEIYRKTLSLVAERKLVVFLPCKTGPENNGEISRCLALKVLFWQLTILRRTCRETVLSIITGVWSHTRM